MHRLLENMIGAPWWVYIIFAYLLAIGIWSLRPRTTSIYRFLMIPSILFLWSIYVLYLKVMERFSLLLIPFWAIALAIGIYLGVLVVRSWPIRGDRLKGQITFPGNYSTLILLMIVFIIHFVFGYIEATMTRIPYWLRLVDVLTSSLIAGFFSGRALVFFYRYRHSK